MYEIRGFPNYFFDGFDLFKKPYCIRHSLFTWQYRKQINVKVAVKDGYKGYYLNGCFFSMKQLRLKLIKYNN